MRGLISGGLVREWSYKWGGGLVRGGLISGGLVRGGLISGGVDKRGDL